MCCFQLGCRNDRENYYTATVLWGRLEASESGVLSATIDIPMLRNIGTEGWRYRRLLWSSRFSQRCMCKSEVQYQQSAAVRFPTTSSGIVLCFSGYS